MSEHRGSITREGERYPSPRRALEYLDVDPPKPGHAVQVGERLWWARMPLPIELGHINIWLLDDGEAGWTLVDTGMSDDASRAAWQNLEQQYLQGRRLHRIFITHDHPDHMGLARWLVERNGAQLWMSAVAHGTASQYLAMDPQDLRRGFCAFAQEHGMPVPPGAEQTMPRGRDDRWYGGIPALDRASVEGEVLAAGGREWRLIETGGHCRGHLCLHDAAGEVLIAGDQVLPTISPNVSVLSSRAEGNPLRDFLDSLGRLEACSIDTLVLPSHGRPFLGLHRRIGTIRKHHLEHLELLLEACRGEPRTTFELVPVMFGRTLRGFHRFLALGEALAHLHCLWHDGRMERTLGDDGVYRFGTSGDG